MDRTALSDAEVERLAHLNPIYEGFKNEHVGLNIRMHVRAIAAALDAPRPLEVGEGEVTEAMEALSDALFLFSGSVNELGLLANEVAHQRYEAVVSTWQRLDRALAVSPAGQRGE